MDRRGCADFGRSSDGRDPQGRPIPVIRLTRADQPVAGGVDHVSSARTIGPDEVRKMSATPNSTLANSEQLIVDLQRQLAECKAERDEALAQQTATAEVL